MEMELPFIYLNDNRNIITNNPNNIYILKRYSFKMK